MDFSSLVKAVQDFWSFIWPPILCTVALIGIALFVAPNWCKRVEASLIAVRPSPARQIAFVKFSKRFGFDKLAPVVAAFTLLFLLSATENVMLVLGSFVPIEITYNPDILLQSHGSNPRVADLWFSYGGTSDVHGFSEQIQQTVDEARQKNKDSSVVSGFQYWGRTAGGYIEMFNACKFLIPWSVAMFLFELRSRRRRLRSAGRCLLLVLMLFFAGATYGLLYLYAINQQEFAALSVAEVYKAPEAHNCYGPAETPDAKCQKYEEMMQPSSFDEKGRLWWNVEFTPSSVARWVFQEVMRPVVGSRIR